MAKERIRLPTCVATGVKVENVHSAGLPPSGTTTSKNSVRAAVITQNALPHSPPALAPAFM